MKKRGISLTINIDRKFFYLLLGVIVIFSVLGIVYATFTPVGQYHESTEVKVTINGTEYSLQDAIDQELIGKIPEKTRIIDYMEGTAGGVFAGSEWDLCYQRGYYYPRDGRDSAQISKVNGQWVKTGGAPMWWACIKLG